MLHPPERVKVVAFFITARYAGQNDREAFMEKAIGQLALLAGQEVSPAVGERGRQEQLFALYRDAALAVRDRGGRLVLVVDGLDEDRGITAGADAHSIAALLPARPPAGMRVVVAGRPNPPIPEDVPAGHPLRAAGVVRLLAASPHALVVRDEARRELRGLLAGGGLGRDLLGLLTAAGGGLSSADLTALTSSRPFETDALLRAVSGRTFGLRPSHFAPQGEGAAALHILGHEELQQAAREGLGPDLLGAYRRRLHAWADSHRDRGWPADTPEYLLRGYTAMLAAAGEAERLTALATDRARQDRLLDISGGDAVALADVAAAQEAHAARPEPDLEALARLAVHRQHLTARNSAMPETLPAVWERLGHPVRAENLARSLASPFEQCQGLALMADAAGKSGDLGRARQLLRVAEEAAQALVHSAPLAAMLGVLAYGAAEMGDEERARRLARQLTGMARVLPRPEERVVCRGGAAAAHAKLGDEARARELARDALAAAREEPHPGARIRLVALTCALVAKAVGPDEVRRLAAEAAEDVRGPSGAEHRDQARSALAQALAMAGDRAGARRLLEQIGSAKHRAEALHGLALAGQDDGDNAWVADLVPGVERAARAADGAEEREEALVLVTSALALLGRLGPAESLLTGVSAAGRRAKGLAAVATAAAAAGEPEPAVRLAQAAETAVRSAADAPGHVRLTAGLALALALTGATGRARELALHAVEASEALADPRQRAWLLPGVVAAAVAAGFDEQADGWIRALDPPEARARCFARRAQIAAEAGDRDRTARLVEAALAEVVAVVDPYVQCDLRITLSGTAVACGLPELAERLLAQAREPAQGVVLPGQRAHLLPRLLGERAQQGDGAAAEAAARAEGEQDLLRTRCLAAVAAGLARRAPAVRDTAAVLRLAAEAEGAAPATTGAGRRGPVLRQLAEALARVGDWAGAERVVRSVVDDVQRGYVHTVLARIATDPVRARRHCAEALRLDVWSSVLADGGPVAWRLAGVLADEYAAVTAAAA